MTLTARRRPSTVNMLVAPLFALASGSLAYTLPVDLARGDTSATQRSGATPVVNAEVMVLLGTDLPGGGAIDPAIGNMPQLRKPPLSAYNSYRLLDKRTLALPLGRNETYTMLNGRVLHVTAVEPTSEHGYRVKAAITQPGGNAYLKQLELTAKVNEPFFVAGQQFHGGTLILAITLRR